MKSKMGTRFFFLFGFFRQTRKLESLSECLPVGTEGNLEIFRISFHFSEFTFHITFVRLADAAIDLSIISACFVYQVVFLIVFDRAIVPEFTGNADVPI